MITDKSIELIADQLGIATEHVYEIFVAAQPTLAIMQLLGVVVVVGFVILGCYSYKRYEWAPDEMCAGIVCGMIGMVVALVLYDCARCYFLPEYSAIIKLMELLVGGI